MFRLLVNRIKFFNLYYKLSQKKRIKEFILTKFFYLLFIAILYKNCV